MIVPHPALARTTRAAAAAETETARARIVGHLEAIMVGLRAINESSAVAPPGAFDALGAMIGDIARLDFAALLRGEDGPDGARLRAATCQLARVINGILARACALYSLDDVAPTLEFDWRGPAETVTH